jgi:hypothetical protein
MYENAGALQLKEIQNRYNLGKAQLSNAMKIAQMDSRDKRYGIETQRDIAREQIAQARLEMERIGIPRVEIERFVAEKNYEIAQIEIALKREVAEAELTGMFQGNPTMAARKMEQELGLAEGALTGVYQGKRTLAGQQHDLAVSQFGAQLASTPDTYFQARRFQGVDMPRLMGGAGAATTGPTGDPTPGVATMGAYLAGQDPYGAGAPAAGGPTPTPYGGAAPTGAGAAPAAAPDTAAGAPATPAPAPGGGPDPNAQQLAAIAKASPPSPYDGLNEQDTATLKLMESVYKRGGQAIAGGELERLAASGRIGFLRSAGNLLGYSPQDLESQYQAYRPSQSAGNLA